MPCPVIARNLEHYHNPQASYVWSEMMCVYHLVLDVTENDRLIIAEKNLTVKEGQTFDFANAKEITKEEHCKLITYSGNIDDTKGPTFVADVMTDNHIAKGMVEQWKKEYHGKYKPYTEEIETNETVISELPDHVVGASPVLQDEELCQKEKTLRAIGYLENDLNALLSGEWFPDKHSVEASLDNLRIVQEFVSSK